MTNASAETRTLVIEREVPYPPAKIWRALTEGPLLEEWLMKNDFQPIVGHRFSFRSTPVPGWDGIIQSEVLAIEPPERLVYRWDSMGLASFVAWTLKPTANGTMIRMEQSGFGPNQDAAFKGANYGWQRFIGNLERVIGGLE